VAATNHSSSDTSRHAVEVRQLTRVYKTRRDVTTALQDVDLTVEQGEL
jgi:ABC-type oligopeptide transport system ATPase subunit